MTAIMGQGDVAVIDMPAVTLWQPWASLIAEGAKTIETRSWKAPARLIGQRIAIHAAKRRPYRDLDHLPGDVEEGFEVRWMGEWRIAFDLFDRPMRLNLWNEDSDVSFDAPFGAVVATARLSHCLPMVPANDPTQRNGEHRLFVNDRELSRTSLRDRGPSVDISDQRPYGDFAPGRWAWMLADIEKLPEPIPASGKQGVWRWTPPDNGHAETPPETDQSGSTADGAA